MNRTWAAFLIIAIILMLAVTGYEFFVSLSGANVTFSKTVSTPADKLGTEKLQTFIQGSSNLLVKDQELDKK